MKKLWERLKNAAAALAGRTSAPAPVGGGKKPQLKLVEHEKARGGFLASGASPPQKSGQLREAVLAKLSQFTTAQGSGSTKKLNATSPAQKTGQLKEAVLAKLLRPTPAQGSGSTKKPSATSTAQKIGQALHSAKFAAKHKKSAPRDTQVASKQKKEPAPQFKVPAQANGAPPQLEPMAYPATSLESAVTTVTPSSSVLDATLLNEMLSLQYRRCASSIDEQEVL